MADTGHPRPPRELGPSGRALWRSIHAALGDEHELDERELAVLRLACAQRDDIAGLERALRDTGLVARGSKGQPRLSQVVTEVRQARLALSRLLGEIKLPDIDEVPRSASSQRAQHAANVRWDLEDARTRRRAHGAG